MRTARFVYIENGSEVNLGDSGLPGISGAHKLVGFKPAGGRKLGGWLVFLVAPGVGKTPSPMSRVARKRRRG